MAEHKHAAVLRAIADGKDVQYLHNTDWTDPFDLQGFNPIKNPHYEWRIKPEPKPDVVRYVNTYATGVGDFHEEQEFAERVPNSFNKTGLIRLTWDGETGKLKSAEVLP